MPACSFAWRYRFITEWHVPESWQGRVAEGRTFPFSGVASSSLTCTPTISERTQTLPGRRDGTRHGTIFMVRTVAWKANHDQGRSGIPSDQLRAIVADLSARGKVHISAEGDLPPDLKPTVTGARNPVPSLCSPLPTLLWGKHHDRQ
jgi:hypothetical protein